VEHREETLAILSAQEELRKHQEGFLAHHFGSLFGAMLDHFFCKPNKCACCDMPTQVKKQTAKIMITHS